jgi:hypothetical protein
MNEKIRLHVENFNEANGFEEGEDSVIETILDADVIWVGERSNSRWWTDCLKVVSIDGMLIGYDGAETTGDDSPSDKWWEFDPATICEVEAKEITTTTYIRRK